jgi:hypothetical protein
VFFVAGFDATFVYALGGNQNDCVCVTKIPRNAVIAYRWPPGEALPGKSAPTARVSGVAEGARED